VPRKPDLKLRQPPKNHVQAFVQSGSSDVQTTSSSNGRTAKQSKPERKQVTVYLAPELAKKLKLQAASTGRQMSDITSDALSKHLSRSS